MLTTAEIIILSMQYSHESIRTVLHDVLPDGSNIAEVSTMHNIPVCAISHWFKRTQHNAETYELKDEPGFVLAKIVE